jgi:glutathione peroxidase
VTSNFFELGAKRNNGKDLEFSEFAGRPILVVNTASKCGFTYQYKGLEALHRKYADQGLVVLGFPCDQFGHQEPGSDAEIAQFCQVNFGVTFPLMTKIEVNGKNADPVFTFLKKRAGGLLSIIKWNFTKFLVAKDGIGVRRYEPGVAPEALEADIEAALAAPAPAPAPRV